MNTLIDLFAFIFGTAIGSFLNVVALRYNTGLSIGNDRSRCFSCGKVLAWFELIPVLSFAAQKARCRGCGSRVSWQYPVVEVITGLVFLGIVWLFPITSGSFFVLDLFYAIIWSLLIVIVIYDLKHKIIPDDLSYAFAFLVFIKLFVGISVTSFFFVVPSVSALASGFVLFLPFYAIWFFSGGRWMGLGDAKLALGIGWFLGLIYGVSAVVLAFWVGAAVGILLIILKKVIRHSSFHRLASFLGIGDNIMKSEIPFAPFLVLGVLIVFFFKIDVTGLSLLIQASF